ncbi:Tetratricopeptide repeat protein [Legionella nautarum]|uniref:Tetratricopeptide repeat protein n=1 Tax=Legionella nautarum TaxID=45070 RepID=A0A0W0WWR0_9GAMM|nr:hypothetical protein [Legionella nautarum]KTD36730.1 Tetratricopeptide repeat protein [Legionella nautarum]
MKSIETARDLHGIGDFQGIIKLSQSIDFLKYVDSLPDNNQAETNLLIGTSYFALGDFDQAEHFLLQAKNILDNLFKKTQDTNNQRPSNTDDLELFIQVTNYLGVCYLSTGRGQEGVEQLKLATKAFDARSAPQLRSLGALAYYHLADGLISQATDNSYNEALIASSHAVELYEGDELNVGNALLQQGIICNYLKKFEEAETVLMRAIEQLTQRQEKEEENLLVVDAKHQLSISLLKQSKPEKLEQAIEVLREVLSSLRANNGNNIADILSTQFLLGICHLKKGEPKTANKYLQASLNIFHQSELSMDELKTALALVKWVAQDEKSIRDPSFYPKLPMLHLKNILKAIERLEAQADKETHEKSDHHDAANFP